MSRQAGSIVRGISKPRRISVKAGRLQVVRLVVLPNALPEILTGLRIGLTKGVDLPWRYGLKGSKFLSKPF